MKLFSIAILLQAVFSIAANAQTIKADSLYMQLHEASTASKKYDAQNKLVDFYIETNRDSALYFVNNCIALAEENDMLLDKAMSLADKGHTLMHLEKLTDAFATFNLALEIAGDKKNNGKSWNAAASTNADIYRLKVLSGIHHDFGNMMAEAGNHDVSLLHFREALKIANEIGDSTSIATVLLDLGSVYVFASKPDSALMMEQTVIRVFSQAGILRPLGYANMLIGRAYQKKNNDSLALMHFYKAIAISSGFQNYTNLQGTYRSLTKFYIGYKPNADSAVYYATKTLGIIMSSGTSDYSDVYADFVKAYQLKGNRDSILKYQALALTAKDNAYNKHIATLNKLQQLAIEEQEKLSLSEKREIENRNAFRVYLALATLIAAGVILVILYRGNIKKRKANTALQKAFAELKSTQAQLIQSEKMASLGELTAGIAHEIQNPLNFVNNFSEVNKELAEELKSELAVGNSQLANEIANDIKENSEKINHHGKRADAIVKGMLQHSRKSEGKKELTDINALADEYLRLAYHGLRAKDKNFNAELKTDFDNSIGKINIVPQDVGRVLLNLYNNAFYAVNAPQPPEGGVTPLPPKGGIGDSLREYKPSVTVSTRLNSSPLGGRGVEIEVIDNGGGIPQNIIDKIFQPFFTTKPTGSGTGLGLSLSYDIIKAHGGEIKVESKEGEGTKFIILLPVS